LASRGAERFIFGQGGVCKLEACEQRMSKAQKDAAMTPTLPAPAGPIAAAELVAALITSDAGSELQLVARDGRRLRLAADAATARDLALTLWRALDDQERNTNG
jgi:hypothetical protein